MKTTLKTLNCLLVLAFFCIVACKNTHDGQTFNQELIEASAQINPTKRFKINPDSDTVISGSQGTKIVIKANSFQFKNRKSVTQPINVELKEVYEMSDMIRNNLSTTSDGELLETSGMINFRATSEGKELELKPGYTIRIRFKRTTGAPYMRTFLGQVDSTGINWELDQNNNDTLTFTVEQIKSISPLINPSSDWVISSTKITYGVVGLDTFEISRADVLEDKAASSGLYFALNSSRLNWINCDRFLNADSTINIYVEKIDKSKSMEFLVFKDINSLMASSDINDSLTIFRNIPFDAKVTLLSFRKDKNDYYIATKNKKLDKNDEIVKLKYRKTSLNGINETLKKFDTNL